MWHKIKIYEIFKDGINSLILDLNGRKRLIPFYIWFVAISLVIGGIALIKHFIIPHEFANYTITVISIFTALVFGILFIGPEKFATRVEIYEGDDNDEVINYLTRYKNFTKQFVAQVSFIILISILLIIFLAIVLYLPEINEIPINSFPYVALHIVSAIILSLGYILLILLLILLSNIYTMMNDDINIHIKKIGK